MTSIKSMVGWAENQDSMVERWEGGSGSPKRVMEGRRRDVQRGQEGVGGGG